MRLGADIRAAFEHHARAELWRRRLVWPLLELYLDRDQLEDARKFWGDRDANAGQLPADDWVDDISRQRGKSWKWTVIAVVWAHCHPRQRVVYAAQFGTSVRGIVVPTVRKLIDDMPEEFRPGSDHEQAIRENKQDTKWHFPNGSELHASGVNNKHYTALRGPYAHLIIQDEAAFYDDFAEVQEVLRPQLITTMGVAAYASTPPVTPAHPFETVVQAARARGRYSHRTIHNHPRLSPAQVEQILAKEAALKGQTLEQFKRSTYYRREFLCLHVVEETRAVIPEWSQDAGDEHPPGVTWGDLHTAELPRPEFFDTYAALDVGFTRDPHGLLAGYWDFHGARLVIEAELPPLCRMRSDALAQEAHALFRSLWPATGPQPFPDARLSSDGTYWEPYIAVGDAGGHGAERLDEMRKGKPGPNGQYLIHPVHFAPAEKADLESMVNAVRMLAAAGKLWVHPRCVHLRKQLAMGLWADRSRSDFERTSDGHLDHLAALVYLVRRIDRQRNPFPLFHGVDKANTIVYSPSNSHNSEVRELNKLFGG